MNLPPANASYDKENEAQTRAIIEREENAKHGATPTATAGAVEIPGRATTYLRSDGAPAVQLASITVGNLTGAPGLVQPDGKSIVITGNLTTGGNASGNITGNISSVISVQFGNATAIAGPHAIAGNATTAMRSDAAPAIQLGNATVPGIVQVDGTTITAVNGVISGAAGASGHNPTATAGPVAINGTAVTFLRSDGAPAVQKASASQFGIVEVDGTTITSAAGVISASAGNPSATAGPAAVNGSAASFMRSDGAPAIQKCSASQFGICEVDGTTITAAGGVISAVASGATGILDMQWFGDGSDGNVTINSGTTTISRDMYYNNLTLSGTGKLVTNGYRVFVAGILDISAAGAGAINFNGNAGSTSSAGAHVGNSTGNTVGGSANAGGGGGVGTGAGSQGGAAVQVSAAFGGVGATSGAGGTGVSAGGALRAPTAPNDPFDIRTLTITLGCYYLSSQANFLMAFGGNGGGGGGGGGGDGTNIGGPGGGGGSGAGVLFLAAQTIARGTNSTAGIIQAMGGAGAAGSNSSAGNTGGGGGGAGGGGGWIYLIWHHLTGSAITNAIDATGGAGGAGGNGHGTGNGGDGGGGGGGGRIDKYDIGAGTQSITAITAATAGNAHSGASGGALKAATTQQVSL